MATGTNNQPRTRSVTARGQLDGTSWLQMIAESAILTCAESSAHDFGRAEFP
jgi:hypothetical protein